LCRELRRSAAHAAAGAVRRRESGAQWPDVIDELIADDDRPAAAAKSLRHQDLRDALVDEAALPTRTTDLLAGPFAHVVVDEARS
jgi:hypothetical protein